MAIHSWQNRNPVGRLKNVSIAEVQNAIAETLLKLGVVNDEEHGKLLVSIKTMEFSQYYTGLKILLDADWVSDWPQIAPETKVAAKSA
jgi:hypothetical protein